MSTCGMLLKTNWRVTERLLHNQGYKKDTGRTSWKGKRSNQFGTHAPGRGTRGKRRLQRQRFSPKNDWCEPHVECPTPGIQHREDAPPWLVPGPDELTGGLWEACTLLTRSAWTLPCPGSRADQAAGNQPGPNANPSWRNVPTTEQGLPWETEKLSCKMLG